MPVSRSVQVELHVEAGLLSHMFYRYREAHALFNTASKLSCLDIQLTGGPSFII